MNSYIVKFDKSNSPKIVHIRTKVFVEEQGVDANIDFDNLDNIATHVLVYHHDKAVGTGRLLKDGHIGRMAVLKESRGLGVGSTALQMLLVEAKKEGYLRVYLGSQTHAIEFYKKFGFKVCSKIFMEAGIEHVDMELIF